MKFYKIKEDLKPNTEFVLSFYNKDADLLKLTASSYYTIFEEDKVIDFGPTRSSDAFYRERVVYLKKDKNIYIKFIYYGIPTFEFANHDFVFGIELLNDNKEIDVSKISNIYKSPNHIEESAKFSFQRGFIERYDLTRNINEKLTLIEIEKQNIKSSHKVNNSFEEYKATLIKEDNFNRFTKLTNRNYLKFKEFENINLFNVDEYLLGFENKDLLIRTFEFDREITGLIKIDIDSEIENADVLVLFDEYIKNDELIIGKDNDSNIVCIKAKKGINKVLTNVPYSYKSIIVIASSCVKVDVSSILIENNVHINESIQNKDVSLVLNAAINSFNQNSYDIFTDCPCRERAGWLCDSYFTGMAENLLTGKNDIEKIFLENLIYSKSVELPENVLAMCYPAEHMDHTFIPNWCLWFIVEVERYFNETKDFNMLEEARHRIYQILDYFKNFELENGLLNDLESWVFVEWSKANDDEFIKGINFPSNMLYYAALNATSRLYNDVNLRRKSDLLKQEIIKYSYKDGYFLDNARYENGAIVVNENCCSETCQYYAAFFDINSEKEFIERILAKSIDSKLAPSAPFIGKVLRLLLLDKHERYPQIIDEFVPYYSKMAEITGTLWEKLSLDGSLNHGFASVVGPIILNAYKKA